MVNQEQTQATIGRNRLWTTGSVAIRCKMVDEFGFCTLQISFKNWVSGCCRLELSMYASTISFDWACENARVMENIGFFGKSGRVFLFFCIPSSYDFLISRTLSDSYHFPWPSWLHVPHVLTQVNKITSQVISQCRGSLYPSLSES
jgi:hypothetical protein